MQHDVPTHVQSAETFPTDPSGLPASRPTEVVELADGETFEMSIEPVAKQIGDETVRMLGYSGSVLRGRHPRSSGGR